MNSSSAEEAPEQEKESSGTEENRDVEAKTDIKKLIAIVPPPSALLAKQRKVTKEKRVRLIYDQSVEKGEAKISRALAEELNVKSNIEVSIAGKKRFKFKAIVLDAIPSDVVYVNSEIMRAHGVANNSICTIRSADG